MIIKPDAMLTACGSERVESSSDTESSNVSVTDRQSENESEKEADISQEAEDEPADPDSVSSGSKILVAWFSCTGTTEQVAGWIAEETGADRYEIVPEDPYTEEDLAYYTGGRADQEQAGSSARPAISGSVENIEQYDVIFLGYPIWRWSRLSQTAKCIQSACLTGM